MFYKSQTPEQKPASVDLSREMRYITRNNLQFGVKSKTRVQQGEKNISIFNNTRNESVL